MEESQLTFEELTEANRLLRSQLMRVEGERDELLYAWQALYDRVMSQTSNALYDATRDLNARGVRTLPPQVKWRWHE